MKPRRRRLAALGLSALLILSTAACTKHDNAGAPTPTPSSPAATSAAPSPTKKPSPAAPAYDPLSGGKPVSGPVIGVKIDNVAQARPQAGVYLANMVVVERVEGNLTRLLGIYHTHWPTRVGPVRSARNTDIQLLPMFSNHPGLVFSGANRKVLRQLGKSPIRQIPRDTRDNSRIAPHNVIVNLAQLRKLPGIGRQQSIGFTFGQSGQWGSAARAASVTIPIGVDRFGFRYTHGHYRGTWNGRAQVDEHGTPVQVSNIVDLKVKYHKDTNTTSNKSYVAQTVGRGTVIVYSRGRKITGTWHRSSVSGPMSLRTSGGKDIKLDPGQTWIMLDG